MAINYYPKASSSINPYGVGATTGAEPDLRQEMTNTIQGDYPEIAKGQTGILRRMRRDDSNNTIPCDCIDDLTKEPDKSSFCPECYGLGALFDEEYVTFYKVLQDQTFSSPRKQQFQSPGVLDDPFIVFYFEYDIDITQDDRIMEISLDEEGDVNVPVTRLTCYRIDKTWAYRSDNGRIEYWKVYTHKEELKYLEAPSFGS